MVHFNTQIASQAGFEDAVLINKENFSKEKLQLPWFARTVFKLLLHIEKGNLLIQFPNNQCVKFSSDNPGPTARLHLHNWKLARKLAMSGTIGAAESYMDKDWDSPDITSLLAFFLINRSIYSDLVAQTLITNLVENIRHWIKRNTKAGSQRNIATHYDLGNDFYSQWLDPSMSYSSAIYKDGANSLEQAQKDKYHSLAERMGVTQGSHILEIGCGWGGFAEFMALEYDARVTGLTISREQLNYARKRIQKSGLAEKVELRFQDYRDEVGKYDHIASIEMFEAVGEQYWPAYFNKINQCLNPGGTAGLQIITIKDEAFEQYRKRPDFIQRYIFPGGMLPCPAKLTNLINTHGLKLENQRIFAKDYAKTLLEWRLRFQKSWNEINRMGFDQRFKRMWEFYFHYCEAGFATNSIDVRQMFCKHV